MSHNVRYLVQANQRRNESGAARQVEQALAAREVLDTITTAHPQVRGAIPRYRTVLDLRVTYPKATLTELAELAGMTNPTYWRALKRALALAERTAA